MALESAQVAARSAVTTLILAASTFVGIAQHESFVEKARIPVPGDKPTYGYGTTTGVKVGDRITPERALQRLMVDVDTIYAQGVRKCVTVPLYPYEFGAYVSLTYNIGVGAFCKKADKKRVDEFGRPDPEPDRLIDLINSRQYARACERIDAFNKGPGRKVLPGLVIRRAAERKICEGRG